VVQKREYVNEVNHIPEIPIYRGTADRAKLPHGYGADKTSPGAPVSGPIRPGGDSAPEGRTYVPEGTEKKPIVFRSIGIMQRSQYHAMSLWSSLSCRFFCH